MSCHVIPNPVPKAPATTGVPSSGSLGPLPTSSSTPRSSIVAVSPDGNRVAYAQPVQLASKPGKRLAEVVVADADGATHGRVFALPASDSASGNAAASKGDIEEIRDVTWTP